MNDAKHEATLYGNRLRSMRLSLDRMANRLDEITPDRIKTRASFDLDKTLGIAVDLIDVILDGIDFETGYLRDKNPEDTG